MPIEHDTFHSRLQRFMDAKGYNQTSLANESGIDRSAINRMIKGSRQPSPFEIGILAQCFEASPDDLMAGLQLPPQIQRVVDRERERTERVLAAEAARDEAIARADQLAAEVERTQREREHERHEALADRNATDAKWSESLRKAEAANAGQRRSLETRIEAYKGVVEGAGTRLRDHEATQLVLRSQIVALQQQIARERSTKAGASVLGGLVGIALGRAMD